MWRHQVCAASHTLQLLYTRVCCHSAASHTHLLTQGRWRPMLQICRIRKRHMKVYTLFQQKKEEKTIRNILDAGTFVLNAAVLSRKILVKATHLIRISIY